MLCQKKGNATILQVQNNLNKKDASIRAVRSSHQQHFVGNGGRGECRFEEKKKIQTDLVFSEVNNF